MLSRRRRPGPLAGRLDAVRRAAGQPGARRAQPGGQGGPAAQHGRRRARALPRGRRLGGARARRRRRSASTPSTSTGTADALHARLRMDPANARERARRCARRCAARTAADWLADQLAAAQLWSPTRRAAGRRGIGQWCAAAPPPRRHRPPPGRRGPPPRRGLSSSTTATRTARQRPRRLGQPPTAAKAGRSPRSSPKTATAERPHAGGQVAHHRPLVHVERGPQLELLAARGAPPGRAALWRSANASTQSPGSGPGASAASRSGPWARRRRPAGASAVASATTSSMTAAQLVVRRARAGALQPVEAGQRDAAAAAQHLARKAGPARDHRHQGEADGEVGQERGHAGQRARRRPGPPTMAASVPSKSRKSRPAPARRERTQSSGGAPQRRPGRATSGVPRRRRRRRQVRADDHDDVDAGDAGDRDGGRERQDLRRLEADGGGDGRRLLLLARRVVDGRRRLGGRRVDRCLMVQPPRR